MILLRRLTAILLTLVAALCSSTAAGGAVPHVAPNFGTYAYDDHHRSAGLVDIPTEPGPLSSSYRDGTAYDAVDGWAHGASADLDAIAPSTATTYNDLATLVHVESAGPTTRGATQVTDGRSVVCDRTSVAAETESGASSVLRLPPEDSWGSPSSLARHFRDHGADFGATSAEDYANQASQFLQRSQREGLPTKIDSDGVIRVYDPETNTFGSFNSDGTTKTFFTPKNGIDYWNRQPGSPPWTGQ